MAIQLDSLATSIVQSVTFLTLHDEVAGATVTALFRSSGILKPSDFWETGKKTLRNIIR